MHNAFLPLCFVSGHRNFYGGVICWRALQKLYEYNGENCVGTYTQFYIINKDNIESSRVKKDIM